MPIYYCLNGIFLPTWSWSLTFNMIILIIITYNVISFISRGEGAISDKLYWWLAKCRRWPTLAFQLVQNLAKHAFNISDSKIRPYRRSLALQMITAAFANNAFQRNTNECHEFEKWLWKRTKKVKLNIYSYNQPNYSFSCNFFEVLSII